MKIMHTENKVFMDNMYSGYGSIANIYDKINDEIDYAAWADFIEKCFANFLNEKPSIVLDLACGTGSMTMELAKRGYDMIGADGSEEMLSIAYEKMYSCENAGKILYIRQDMRSFELYGTVGAVTCCLDSINYLSDDGDIDRCFSLVHNYLDPDGLFIFDVNTPYKFENVYSDNAYIHEDELDGRSVLCAWQNEYDKNKRLCNFYLSVFEQDDSGAYIRTDEAQVERCFERDELEAALMRNGFELIGAYGSYELTEAQPNDLRWYFVARAKKGQE